MAIRQSPARRRPRREFQKAKNRSARPGPRRLNLEPFEERTLFAVGLVAAYSSEGVLLDLKFDQATSVPVLHEAPTELQFRFDSNIDEATLSSGGIQNIQVRRSVDGVLGNGNDVDVVVPFLGLTNTPTDVVARFANPLVDDLYEVRIVGSGDNPLKNIDGEVFNDGSDLVGQFELDLGAQVVAIVPQPVTRGPSGALVQDAAARNQIDVYFNRNDPLNVATAQDTRFYQLIRTQGTETTSDDIRFNPTSVSYNSATGKAILRFADGHLTTPGLYRLRIGDNDPLAFAPVTPSLGSAGSSFATAANFGTIFLDPQATQSVDAVGTIDGSPVTVVYPGGPDEPGGRNIPLQSHLLGSADTSGVIPIISYNFKPEIGTVQGAPSFNSITEPQKQRVREVMSYYAGLLGLQFVETASSGFTIATGDPRVVAPGVPPTSVGGIAGGGVAVMNAGLDWGNSGKGGAYFRTAMHEIGHLLGLGHTHELPPLTIQGSSNASFPDAPAAEGIFPGDFDIVLGRYLHPPVGNDIDVYRFSLDRAGKLNFETFAERMRKFDSSADPSHLDSVLTVFDSAGNILARNDDYFGKDSFLQLQMEPGNYFVAVTSTGNTDFDPSIEDTGFGGTSQGDYRLRLTFTPASNVGIKDATGTVLDGDGDGAPGGVHNFWFRVASPERTIFVDKAATGGTGTPGSLTNPYTRISNALAAATAGGVVRIVGNGGVDGDLATVDDNFSYNIGFDNINRVLSDGSKFEIPKDVTVMVDAGTILKLRAANINAGSVAQGIDLSGGALQVLGTTASNAEGADIGSVYITSYYNDAIGTDPNTAKNDVAPGDWGGLVFRNDSDLESAGIFMNYVNRAKISYGGGRVVVNSVPQSFDQIHMVTARPTITFNTISNSANAAVSADPNSFEESQFQGPSFITDYTRPGPKVFRNTLSANSINGLFVRVRTDSITGAVIDTLSVSGRFGTTDMVYVIEENLIISSKPGGFFIDEFGRLAARPDGRLAVDPGVLVKLGGSRIETQLASQLIAEGTQQKPIVFTSIFDDRYGAGGVFDTTNDQTDSTQSEGDWGGLFFGPLSKGSVDHAVIQFGGGRTTIEGGFGTFNAVEVHQADVRLTNTTLQQNAAGGDATERAGRGSSTKSIIFVRGAQPIIASNIIRDNDTKSLTNPNAPLKKTAAISINVNALNARLRTDQGRSTGFSDLQSTSQANSGPLIVNNRIGNTPINGMIVRGGRLTTDVVMDDTDIVHVVLDEIIADTQFALSGRLRLQSSPSESLVVKLLGATAGITAAGVPLDIGDRIGGAVQVVGMTNHPVIMTSIFDTSFGAGFDPDGSPQNDTHNIFGAGNPPDPPATSGPIFIDGGDRDDHGSVDDGENQDGWKFIEQAVNFAYNESLNTAGTGILVIGVQEDDGNGGNTRAQNAIESVADVLDLEFTIVTGAEINSVNFADFRMIYVPSDAQNTQGGITNDDLARLANRKLAIQNYVNNVGGGLVALTEASATNPYAWLELPDPFVVQLGGGIDLTQTPLLAAAGFNITDEELTNGTPWHNSFIGPPGFNRLQVWVVDPADGRVVTLGAGAGQGGIGTRFSTPIPGDWRSIKLDDFSNDRNVEIVTELEERFAPTGDTNRLPTTAQYLGELAKNQKSGDDVRRLGFEIHGLVSQTVDSPGGGDADTYSFQGTAGSLVWFDIDRTAPGLDTIVELIDANGAVIAQSNNSQLEQADPSLLQGIAKPMQPGFTGSAGPFTNSDFYSTNPKDAGMRVVLPGTSGDVFTYFVRVRAASNDLARVDGGLSTGEYVLQIRLQNLDEFPGSTVRNADIRYASVGVEVIGKPGSSPLLGDTTDFVPPSGSGAPNNSTFATAQYIGNLLTTDRNEISVSGNITSQDEVLWFRMDLNYDLVQSIGGFSNGLKSFATMFNIEYADGLARPDTNISVFDANGNLLLFGRDSAEVDALPRPSLGADLADQSHASFGVFDATIGPVQLPAGTVQPGGIAPDLGGTGGATYYIAVSSAAVVPSVVAATFQSTPGEPLVRLEPVNSTERIIDDRVGSTGATTAAGANQAFPGTIPIDLNASAVPFTLADVVLYMTDGFDLMTVNPFTGQISTFVTDPRRTGTVNGIQEYLADAAPGSNLSYFDLAMRDDSRLYSFTRGLGDNNTAETNGTLTQIDPGDAETMNVISSELATFVIQEGSPANEDGTYNFSTPDNDTGIQVNGMAFSTRDSTFTISSTDGRQLFVVGNRGSAPTVPIEDPPESDIFHTVDLIPDTQNLLFRLDSNTGAPFGDDFITNLDAHPPEVDGFTPTAYQPYDFVGRAGSGTEVIPRGTLDTGVFLVGAPGSQVTDGDTFSFETSSGNSATVATFEFDTNSSVSGTNIPIPFTPADSTLTLSTRIRDAINNAGINVRFPHPRFAETVTARLQGTNVKIDGSRFVDVIGPFDTDSTGPRDGPPLLFDQDGDIEGLAFLPRTTTTTGSPTNFFFEPDLYAVGDNGGVYKVIGREDPVGGFETSYQTDDNATLKLLNVIRDANGNQVHFTGLTPGPPNVENGRFERTLFASDINGNLYAFDDQGQPAPVFYDGRTMVSTGVWGSLTRGLTFSTLDHNLWQATTTRGGDDGHGLTRSFDFDVQRNPTDPNAVPEAGGNSFYFGLEDERLRPNEYDVLFSGDVRPGLIEHIPTNENGNESLLLSGNQALFGGYNMPGGAYGSIVTSPFSLAPYTEFDKPTLYFNYLADTDVNPADSADGIDGVRVYASTNGATWTQLATNRSVPASTASDASGLQELYDPAGDENTNPQNYQLNDFDQEQPTTASGSWRQARIDLGDFAGQSEVLLRFDFTSAGSMGIGNLLQGGVYVGAVAASKLRDGDSFLLDRSLTNEGTRFTFRQAPTLVVPTAGGIGITNGETFTVGGTTFEFRKSGLPASGNFAVPISDSMTATQVAHSIFDTILANPIAGVTAVRDNGFSLQVPANGGPQLASGETFTVNGTRFQLRRSGDFAGNTIGIAYDGAVLRIEVPGPGADTANGETVTINGPSTGATFELRKSGPAAPGNILVPFTNGSSPEAIAAALTSAINSAGIGVTAIRTGDTTSLVGATSIVQSPIRTLVTGVTAGVGTSTADAIAASIRLAIESAGIGVTAVQNGATLQLVGATSLSQSINHGMLINEQSGGLRVQLVGATGVTQSPAPGLGVEGSAVPSPSAATDIPYLINWTAEMVAQAVAESLDAEFTRPGNFDDPTVFTSSKVIGRTLRMWGHTFATAGESGPLAFSDSLAGQTSPFYSPATSSGISDINARNRGKDNNHEGVFIDDIIIGLAPRGEMATGHFNPVQQLIDNEANGAPLVTGDTTFVRLASASNPPAKLYTGEFQLNIRRGTEYADTIGGARPFISLNRTFDVNDRLAKGFTLIAPPASELIDGQTFRLVLAEGGVFTFEFDMNGSWATGNIRVPLLQDESAASVARKIRDAINNAPPSLMLDAQASVKSESARIDLFGVIDVDEGPLGLEVFNNIGDESKIRTQGATIIQGNIIANTLQAGIVVRPPIVGDVDAGIQNGPAGHTGSVLNLPTLNSKALVPGVTIKENAIIAGGQTAIAFSGGFNTGVATAVPFGRILNNTIAFSPSGIQVVNNASPTILNNIVSETNTAIRVDNSSSTTVVGATVYKNNQTNLAAPGGFLQDNAIILDAGAPLFVDTSKGNFYLAAGSLAIDSSVNAIQERPDLAAVTTQLGIPPSPIQASEFDLFGQLRVDDINVPSPPGLGSNVFKDRGAIERADVLGPVAVLRNPIDNDAALRDSSQVVNRVVLAGRTLKNFEIQLVDNGIGIDDSTVATAKFAITRTIGGTTVTLTPDVDYTINYADTDDIVLLTPVEGVWIDAVYTITIDNSTDPIMDRAGNSLEPNEESGSTRFVIELTDEAASSWQNPENKFDVNADGLVTGLDALLIINRLLLGQAGQLPPVAIVPPYLDVSGDGNLSPLDVLQIFNFLATSSAAPSAAPATATPTPAVADTSDQNDAQIDTLAAIAQPIDTTSGATETVADGGADLVSFGLSIDASTASASTLQSDAGGMAEPAPSTTTAVDSAVSSIGADTTQLDVFDKLWSEDDWEMDTDELDSLATEVAKEADYHPSVYE